MFKDPARTVPSSLTKVFNPVHIPSLHPWYFSRQAKQFDYMQPELGAPIAKHVQEANIHKQVTCHYQFLSR